MKGKTASQKLQSMLLNEFADPYSNEAEDLEDDSSDSYEYDASIEEAKKKKAKDCDGTGSGPKDGTGRKAKKGKGKGKKIKEFFDGEGYNDFDDAALDHDYVGGLDTSVSEMPDEYMEPIDDVEEDDIMDNGFNPDDMYDEYSDEFEDELDNYDDIDALDDEEESFYDELSPDFMPESKKR